MSYLNEDKILPALLLKLDDSEFHRQFEQTTGIEHSAKMKVLHFINDLQRRKSHLEQGYSSVYDYCTRKMGYSRSEAGRRIQAARCGRRYPEVFDMIRSHELSIGIAALIEPILTDENKDDILGRVRGATNREVGRVVSEYRPPVALRDRLDYVRVPAPRPRNLDTFLSERECARVAPLAWQQHMPTEEKVFVQFLADEEFLTLFEEVQKLRSNTDRSFADVMKSALKMYRDQISPVARKARRDKKKAAKEARADARKRVISPDSQRWESNDAAQSRHIPDELRDEVHVRDAGKCMFVAADGTRCESTHDVEVDHVNPFSSGGIHDSANLRLLCGPHNRLVAEQVLGKHVMDPFWRRQ